MRIFSERELVERVGKTDVDGGEQEGTVASM